MEEASTGDGEKSGKEEKSVGLSVFSKKFALLSKFSILILIIYYIRDILVITNI